MQQIRRSAIRKAAQAGGSRAFGYGERFSAVQKGSGVSKTESLKIGINASSAPSDAASLAKMWPVKEDSAAETAAAAKTFAGVVARNAGDKAAAIGKARAETSLSDFEAAKATLAGAGITSTDGEYYRAYLAAKAAVLVREIETVTAAQAAEPGKQTADTAVLQQQATETFRELISVKQDWESLLAYGEYLIQRGDAAAASVLSEAAELAQREATGRAGTMERYVAGEASTAALADYVDYKHQVVFQNKELGSLLGSTDRTEPAMEKLLAERYPGYSAEELLAVLPLASSIEAGALGLGDIVRETSRVNVRSYDSAPALELNYLLEQYTGAGLGAASRGAGDNVDSALANIEGTSDVADISKTIRVQKQLAVTLAEETRDRCNTRLGAALNLAGKHGEALKVLNDVVKRNKYTGMYHTFKARAEANLALGNIEAADKDSKKAYSLEDALVDVDIPTWDSAAHRNEF